MARKAVLPAEVLSCALDTISAWDTRPVGAPGSSSSPVSSTSSRVHGPSEGLQEVRAGTPRDVIVLLPN